MSKTHHILKTAVLAVFAFSSIVLAPSQMKAQIVQVRGIEHVGLNVPDMDAAIKFFSTMFGFTLVTEMKDIPVDDGLRKIFHMHNGAKVKSIVMLRAGSGINLELFQYDSPESVKEQPFYDDAGAAHEGFYTDDMNGAVAALRAKGITVLTDPIVMNQGPTAGETWTYFLTPWRAKLELVTYPNGEAYEQVAGAVHLWTPPAADPGSTVKVSVEQVQILANGYRHDPKSAIRIMVRSYHANFGRCGGRHGVIAVSRRKNESLESYAAHSRQG